MLVARRGRSMRFDSIGDPVQGGMNNGQNFCNACACPGARSTGRVRRYSVRPVRYEVAEFSEVDFASGEDRND